MNYVDLILVGISGGLLSVMYNYLLKEDMILEKLGFWLEGGEWYKKILGGCIYCNCVYVCLFMLAMFSLVPVVWSVLFMISITFNLVVAFVELDLV